MEKCFAGKLACGVRKANALHTSSELFAFAKSFVCWVEVSKKRSEHIYLYVYYPEYSPLGLVLKICKLSFTNKHRSIYCCLARGVRKASHCSAERTFFAWAKNRSLALCGSPKKQGNFLVSLFFWRHHPESNWGWKFCRLLPYRLAMVP